MRVIIGCEFSQVICKAFRAKGHEAYSCDIIPCEGGHPEWHYQEDILKVLEREHFDMGIFHPECTYLSNAGIGWFNEERYGDKARERKEKRLQAFGFFMALAHHKKIKKKALENPVGWVNSHWRKPDQTIQPWMFGDAESKRTCLWLENLPPLLPTEIVSPKIYAYYKTGKKKGMPIYGTSYMHFSENRGKERSVMFQGIAEAMANQWG